MKRITSYKAVPISADLPVDDLEIVFDRPADDVYPAGERSGDERPDLTRRRRYRVEADRIVDALEAHLPGGLLDALFASLCARKASCLRVPDIDRTKGD